MLKSGALSQGGLTGLAPKKTAVKLPILPPFSSPESIVEALGNRDVAVQTAALRQLEQAALASSLTPAAVTPALEYLNKFPTVDGVFSNWDIAQKTNNSQLSTAVLNCLTALIRLISTDPFASEPECIRRILSHYAMNLDRGLNPGRNDVTVATLKLCLVIVGFGGGRFAKRLFGKMQWQQKVMSRLLKIRQKDHHGDPLDKPDIRTLLSMLILAFLSVEDSHLKVQVIETKVLVSGVLRGISEDHEIILNHILVALHRDIVMDRSIRLEDRRAIFDESAITELCKVYDVADGGSGTARTSINRFLYAIFEWLAIQVNESQSRSIGPQKIIGTILRTLRVTEDAAQRELGLHILERLPILAGTFWSRFPSSLDPRLSSRWISAVTFATNVISLPVSPHLNPDPINVKLAGASTPPSLTSVMDNIFPPSLNKSWFSKAIPHENELVSFLSSLLLLAGIQKATNILSCIVRRSRELEETRNTGRWLDLAKRLRKHLKTILPDPQIIVAVLRKASSTSVANNAERTATHEKEGEYTTKTKGNMIANGVDHRLLDEGSNTRNAAHGPSNNVRSNIALRLLWLYHRAVPSVISTLRFDFGKLPREYALGKADEGVRAMSSAYALRLSSIHASSGAMRSKPGEHFKATLLPLFDLYQSPSTNSNRVLLQSVLARQLKSTVLFGSIDNLNEIEVWLKSLEGTKEEQSAAKNECSSDVMEFFEENVQKTMTQAISEAENSKINSHSHTSYSPLLKVVIFQLRKKLRDGNEISPAIGAFLCRLVLGFIGHSNYAGFSHDMVDSIFEHVNLLDSTKGLHYTLQSFTKAIDTCKPTHAKRANESDAFYNPITSNIFLSGSSQDDAPIHLMRTMPIELAFLHTTSESLGNKQISNALLELVEERKNWLSPLRILLHRFKSNVIPEQQEVLTSFILAMFKACLEAPTVLRMKQVVFGDEGFFSIFVHRGNELSEKTTKLIACLIRDVLSPFNPSDAPFVRRYCDVLIFESKRILLPKKGERSGKGEMHAFSPRFVACCPLLSFLSDNEAVDVLMHVLDVVRLGGVNRELNNVLLLILRDSFDRFSKIPTNSRFISLWTEHFVTLHRMSQLSNLSVAGDLLAIGAAILLPRSLAAGIYDQKFAKLDITDYQYLQMERWEDQMSNWLAELLNSSHLTSSCSIVLSALIYRSSNARLRFIAYLQDKKSIEESFTKVIALPLRALFEISIALSVGVFLPDEIIRSCAQQVLLLSHVSTIDENLLRVIQLMCVTTGSAKVVTKDLLQRDLESLNRDSYIAEVVRLRSQLALACPNTFDDNLEDCLNLTFPGLVRKFAEEDKDSPAVILLVSQLLSSLQAHNHIKLKSHLLDPLIVAIVTRRLHSTLHINLGASLCKLHTWSENEVARLLNSIFASPLFSEQTSEHRFDAKRKTALVELVLAISSSSISAAAAARVTEHMMPFYGGTLSTEDVALLSLIQTVEIVSGVSTSASFSVWSPSSEGMRTNATKITLLAATDVHFMQQSALMALGSAALPMSKVKRNQTYDPRFILDFGLQAFAECSLTAQDWTSIINSQILSVAAAALASSSSALRLSARALLGYASQKLEKDSQLREKDELMIVLCHARNCVFSKVAEPIPAVIAHFLSNCFQMLGMPESPLYPALSRFLLQRPLLDQRDVPMFYLAFFTASETPLEDRAWLLQLLANGIVRFQDWKICRRRQVFELASSLFQSSRDSAERKLVLRFLLRATSIPQVARELLTRNGILSWLSAQSIHDENEQSLMLLIILNVAKVVNVEKPGVLADALDAVAAIVSRTEGRLEAEATSTLCQILAALLPPLLSLDYERGPPVISYRVILDRAQNLLTAAKTSSSLSPSALVAFYSAAMTAGFLRYEFGMPEGDESRRIFHFAVNAGLEAGLHDVRLAVLRNISSSS